MSEIAMEIKGENLNTLSYLGIKVIDGISEVGAEEGFLYLIIVSWQLNLIQTLS